MNASLFDKRVILVTGKGGVGKSTVAMAIGAAAARRGKRTLIAETGGATRVPATWGRSAPDYDILPLAMRLSTLSITSGRAVEDYVVQQVKVRAIYQMVFRNRVMGPFMDAVPGLHDLIQLGKVMDLERKGDFDLIVVDCPATGHGLTMIHSPRSMMDLTVAGPFHEGARLIGDLVEDPRKTGIVLVSTPEEMPVNETLDLHRRLGTMKQQTLLSVLNEVHPEVGQQASTLEWEPVHRAVRRQQRQVLARERLGALGVPRVELPFLFRRELGPTDIDRFAGAFS